MVGVELADEALQNIVIVGLPGNDREIGAVAEILAGAEKEHLDAARVARAVERDDVGVSQVS